MSLRPAELFGLAWSSRSGLGTADHWVPFHRSISPPPVPKPAAQPAVPESRSTEERPLWVPTAWVSTTDQLAAAWAGSAIDAMRAPVTAVAKEIRGTFRTSLS